jgi:hypothetical protein
MLPTSTSNIDSSLLKRSIEEWEELLTCQQCHRIVESIAKLWEGENQESLCSECCPKLARSIFACINKPEMEMDNPNASDPGRVVRILKWLLAAYEHQELVNQRTSSTTNNSTVHNNNASTGDVHTTLHQTIARDAGCSTTCHQFDGKSGSKAGDEMNDHKLLPGKKLSGDAVPHDNLLTQESQSQDCIHTSSSYQKCPDLGDRRIQCSTCCLQPSCSFFTPTPSSHHPSQRDLLLSLPETADFERIFPGPSLPAQTSHQSQNTTQQHYNASDEPISASPVEEYSGSSQVTPNETSGHAAQIVEYEKSCSSMLPETVDFDRILPQPNQQLSNEHDTSASPWEESELPSTEDFDKIYPRRRLEDHLNTEITTSNDNPTITPGPTVVSPVDSVTATKLREQLVKDPVPLDKKKQDSGILRFFTPMVRKRRSNDSHTNTVTKTKKLRINVSSPRDEDSSSHVGGQHRSRRAFPCHLRQHPFHKSQADLAPINICARTFQYLHARSNGWTIEGERGETIWGDADLYSQTIAQISAPPNQVHSWIRKAPWWGTTRLSPCQRFRPTRDGLASTKLLDGYKILLISSRDCVAESVSFFDFTALSDLKENNDETRPVALEFKSFTLDEVSLRLMNHLEAQHSDIVLKKSTFVPTLVCR